MSKMDAQVGLFMELYRRHMNAFRDGDETRREKLFNLIEELEAEFPEIREEITRRYPS